MSDRKDSQLVYFLTDSADKQNNDKLPFHEYYGFSLLTIGNKPALFLH